MSCAPGAGPKLLPEQALALEVTRRVALNGSRAELAALMYRLHHDNMLLRQAVKELLRED